MIDKLSLQALPGIPDVKPGDDLARLLFESIERLGRHPQDGDIFAIAQKVVSKAENRYVNLSDVQASPEAVELAQKLNKDPRKIQVILNESNSVVRATPPRPDSDEGILITEHRLGFICANAAIDESNIDRSGSVLLLPVDPDRSARTLRDSLCTLLGVKVGVVITDTFGRPWRRGQIDIAIGIAGFPALIDLAGTTDAYGRELKVTMPAIGDAIAAAAGILMMKNGKYPAILVNGLGLPMDTISTARDILRLKSEDLFR